jgi:SAM-dependent methyltransferase
LTIPLTISALHRPFARYFRRRRFRKFSREFGLLPATRLLDLGGFEEYWTFFDQIPRVTVVNLERPKGRHYGFDWVIADARQLPFRDRVFEIVFSNSVIEHVGDDASRRAFAREATRVGRRYYVQTPNRWFPVEPHLMTPLVHFLPVGIQKRLLRNFTVWGILQRPTQRGCEEFVEQIRLLDARELRTLFPQAVVWRERFLGLTKSLIAVFNPRNAPEGKLTRQRPV